MSLLASCVVLAGLAAPGLEAQRVAAQAFAAAQHRPDLSRQPRLGRGRRLRQRARRRRRRASTSWPREGIRLNNFNVEFSCTVSRAALLTGRYAIRTGATQGAGITLWEVTIAEALKSLGYATALFGKWHLGGDRPEGSARADAPGLRRVLRHSAHEQRGADDDRPRSIRRRRRHRSSGKARRASRRAT